MTTNSMMMSDLTSCLSNSSTFAQFKNLNGKILRKIVNGSRWTQIKGKMRDWQVVTHIVNTLEEGSTLVDVVQHPEFLKLVKNLQELPLQDLTKTKSQGVDVLAAFVQNYTTEDNMHLAHCVRNWALYMADQIVLYEMYPPAPSFAQNLVETMQVHPVFWKHYNFKSWMDGWQHVTHSNCRCLRLISMDCEMVDCGPDLGRCVVRLCIVGSDLKPLIDEFVVPIGPVVNYCTKFHGITEHHLRGVTLTQMDAQARVMKLLKCPGTIVVGHAVFNDLKALKIDFKRVIDTAFLFKDQQSKTLLELDGLAELCERFLGYELRHEGDVHDCMKDAIVPMQLVLHKLQVLRGRTSSGTYDDGALATNHCCNADTFSFPRFA